MTSKETQPTTSVTDPSDSPRAKEIETTHESGDVEDSKTGGPQAETKPSQTTQPAYIDATSGQSTEPQVGAGSDEEEEEEIEEEPEDGGRPPIPKWRVRAPATQNVSRGSPIVRSTRGGGGASDPKVKH